MFDLFPQYFDIFVDFGPCECKPTDRFASSTNLLGNDVLIDARFQGVERAQLKSWFYRLTARGAIVADHLHAEVTHVVVFTQRTEDAEHKAALQVSLLFFVCEKSDLFCKGTHSFFAPNGDETFREADC